MKKLLIPLLLANSLTLFAADSSLSDFDWVCQRISDQLDRTNTPIESETLTITKIQAEKDQNGVRSVMYIDYDLSAIAGGPNVIKDKKQYELFLSETKDEFRTFLMDSSCEKHNDENFRHHVTIERVFTWVNKGDNFTSTSGFDIKFNYNTCVAEGFIPKSYMKTEVALSD